MICFKDGSIKLSENELKKVELLKELHRSGVTKLTYADYYDEHFRAYSIDEKNNDIYVGSIKGLTSNLIFDILISQNFNDVDLTQLLRNFEANEYVAGRTKSVRQIVHELLELGGETLYLFTNPLSVKIKFESGSYSWLPEKEAKLLYLELTDRLEEGKGTFSLLQLLQWLYMKEIGKSYDIKH